MNRKNTANIYTSTNEDYSYNVQILTGGHYAGIGKFCENMRQVKEFCEKYNVVCMNIGKFLPGDYIVNDSEIDSDRIYKIKSISNNGTIKAYTWNGKLLHTSTTDENIRRVNF